MPVAVVVEFVVTGKGQESPESWTKTKEYLSCSIDPDLMMVQSFTDNTTREKESQKYEVKFVNDIKMCSERSSRMKAEQTIYFNRKLVRLTTHSICSLTMISSLQFLVNTGSNCFLLQVTTPFNVLLDRYLCKDMKRKANSKCDNEDEREHKGYAFC